MHLSHANRPETQLAAEKNTLPHTHTRFRIAMTSSSILSPFPTTSGSFSCKYTNYSNHLNLSVHYNINKFNICNNVNALCFPCSCSFRPRRQFNKPRSLFSSPGTHPMPTHIPKSGGGYSWIQAESTQKISRSTHKPMQGLPHSVSPKTPAEVSSVEGLLGFISSGPLISKLSIAPETIAESIDKWLLYGYHLCEIFKLNQMQLSLPQKARIYHYYIPVFMWCEEKISKHRAQFKDGEDIPPLVIGFSAPQGCGKTTLVFALDYLFRVTGRTSATLSIDDFYLTYEGQAKLREANPGNSLLEFRGNAGSHDLQLSIDTLTAVSKLTKDSTKMKLPRYDKSAYNGRGDRADPSTWPEVEGPLTVVLFEGWMLGFKPVPEDVVRAVDPQLVTVNKSLENYYDAWDKFVQAWIVIKIRDPSCVYQWRLQAEIAMRADGKPGMTDEEVKDFVSRYLPAYDAYLPTLYTEGPKGSNPEDLLVIDIDEGRNPILGN